MLTTENHKWFKVLGIKISFEHVDSWAKSFLFRTHHLWNSTTELILLSNEMAYYFLSNWMILFHFSISKPCRCKLKPRFLIKSGYYNVPNSSTALDYKPGQQWHLPISEHISYGVSNSYFEIYSVQFSSVLRLQRP